MHIFLEYSWHKPRIFMVYSPYIHRIFMILIIHGPFMILIIYTSDILIFEKETVLLSFFVSDLGLSGDLRLTALCCLAQLCLRCGGEGRLCLERRAMGLYKISMSKFVQIGYLGGHITRMWQIFKVLRCGKLWNNNINLCFKVTSASSNHSNSMIYPLLFIQMGIQRDITGYATFTSYNRLKYTWVGGFIHGNNGEPVDLSRVLGPWWSWFHWNNMEKSNNGNGIFRTGTMVFSYDF